MTEERKILCQNYLKARKVFLNKADTDAVLQGNDNIIGRIGEAIAHSFLEQQGRAPSVVTHKSNPGYDIICEKGLKTVSVKLITAENTSGSTSKIRHEWEELVGIEIGEDLSVLRIGTITRINFDKELTKRNQSLEPSFSRRMFNKNGIFSVAGKVYEAQDLQNFNLLG